MLNLVAVLAVVGALVWLFGRRAGSSPRPAPEDDVTTPIDRKELEAAERDLADDPDARSLREGPDDDQDDWGPGAS